MCACVCVIGSALTYDPSDSPEGDSGGVSSLETRHCQNVRRSIRAVKEREAKTERERERGKDDRCSTVELVAVALPSIIGDPGLPASP